MNQVNLRPALRSAALLAALWGAALCFSQSPKFYELGQPAVTEPQVASLAADFQLVEKLDDTGNPTGIFVLGDGSVRGVFQGGVAQFMPDLKVARRAPTVADAKALAMQFCDKFGLFTDEPFQITEVTGWSKQPATPDKLGGRSIVLRNVRFARFYDGREVMGPSSRLNVLVDSAGGVGVLDSIRPLIPSNLVPRLKTPYQIEEEFKIAANDYCDMLYEVLGRRQVYWEQGSRYVQPAWMYTVKFWALDGQTITDTILIPMATNAPEPIMHYPADGLPRRQEGFGDFNPIAPNLPAVQSPTLDSLFGPLASANPVQIGEYIVRNDHSCWLQDAQQFWSQLYLGRFVTQWFHNPVNRRDYWWNYVWLWHADGGIPDYSRYYVGQDHYVLIEGHGGQWLITSLGAGGDIIRLKNITGYGTHAVAGEKTCYIQWQSCLVIPRPGTPYGYDYQSPDNWSTVWWSIFKGMRGTYGYNTLMRICNGVSSLHGYRMGLGFPNLSSWLYSTDNGVFGHSSGLDYASAVLVSGHENDTIYQTSQLPPPGSLTIWWTHP